MRGEFDRVSDSKLVPTLPEIAPRIFTIRGAKVIVSIHLAELYGVPHKALMQAVRRNLKRFPDDFLFQLSRQEFDRLKSQIVTSKMGRGGKQKLPYVFTENGLAMLSSAQTDWSCFTEDRTSRCWNR